MKSIILVLIFVTTATALNCNVFWDNGDPVTSQDCTGNYCITFSGKYDDGSGNKGTDTIQACESDSSVQAIEQLANFHCTKTGNLPLKVSNQGMSIDGVIYCCDTDNCNGATEATETTTANSGQNIALKCNVFWDDGDPVTTQSCSGKYCITFSGEFNDGQGNKGKDTIQACESDPQIKAIEGLANFHCTKPGSFPLNVSAQGASLVGEVYCCDSNNCNDATGDVQATTPNSDKRIESVLKISTVIIVCFCLKLFTFTFNF